MLALSSCGGDSFTADSDSGGHIGGSGGSESGGTGGTSSDAGLPDASAGTPNTGGTIGVDAGVECGIQVNWVSHTGGSNVPEASLDHFVESTSVLVVALAIRHDADVPGAIPSPAVVSYAGTALSRVKLSTDAYYQSAELWTLAAPLAGTGTVTVRFEAAPQHLAVGAISITGAALPESFGPASEASGVGASAMLSFPAAGYAAVIDVLSHGGGSDWTPLSADQLWHDGTDVLGGYSSFARVAADMTTVAWQNYDGMAGNFVLLALPIAEAPCTQ
jgi:hypothetical protein